MKVEQIAEYVNAATRGIIGEDEVLAEDLSNIVDIGQAVLSSGQVDNYVRSIANKVGVTLFADRVYQGSAPSILKRSWEYGSIAEKIRAYMPEASDNATWNLVDGEVYEQDRFNSPIVSTKYFNSKVTFEIELSITDRQIKESFQSALQLNNFLSMIRNEVDKAMTIKTDGLISSTLRYAIAETLDDGAETRAINLAQLYFEDTGKTVTLDNVKTDPDFIRYSVMKMKELQGRIKKASKLFNTGGKVNFTPEDKLHIVMLDEFKAAADVYLYSDLFNADKAMLPNAETITYWQGSGTDYSIESTSKINTQTKTSGAQIEQDGILAIFFDDEAVAVTNFERRVTTHYNAKAEFHNNWYKQDAGYFFDGDENFVVFYIGDVVVDEQ